MLKAGNCPICDAKFKNNLALYEHMETDHPNDLNGLGADQYLFNLKYNITGRTCLVCNKSTAWNTKAGRYDRLCGSKKCSDKYRENFKKNMMKVHGSYNLLNDPDQQKKMLENRKISGVYTWSNGVDKFKYTGSYELDFLKFIDLFLGYPPSDIIAPSSLIIRYEYDNAEHFYIPDFELVTLNIVIEVKSTENKHYRLRDIEQEKAKDEAITKFLKEEDKGRQYFKVLDKKYKEFFELILKLRDNELNDDEKTELLLNKETKMKREDFDIFNSRDFTEEEQEIFEKSIILEDFPNLLTESNLFETKISNISGKGNFAKIDIKKGTNLGLGIKKINNTQNPDKDFKRYPICTFTNHSNNPNLIFIKNKNNYYFITNKNINKGEELTINYNLFDFEGERNFTEEEQEIFEKSIILEDSTPFKYFNQSDIERIENKMTQEGSLEMGIRYGQVVETDSKIFHLTEGIRCTKEHGFKVKVYKVSDRWFLIQQGTESFDISNLIDRVEEKYLNESSSYKKLADKKFYFISENELSSNRLEPRVPKNYFTENGYEDNSTKRVCLAPSVDNALMGLSKNIKGKIFYVYSTSRLKPIYPSLKQVPDVNITKEVWSLKPVELEYEGKIQVLNDKGTKGKKFKYGNNEEAELFEWEWEWLEEAIKNESSSLASFASIFFLPISTRPDGYLKLNPELKQYWHTGIIYKGKVYECFNNYQYAISDLSIRKKELEEQEAIYITKEIDLNKLKSEIKSGTSCGTYVARCLGIDNSKGYEKTMYPLDVYNKII